MMLSNFDQPQLKRSRIPSVDSMFIRIDLLGCFLLVATIIHNITLARHHSWRQYCVMGPPFGACVAIVGSGPSVRLHLQRAEGRSGTDPVPALLEEPQRTLRMSDALAPSPDHLHDALLHSSLLPHPRRFESKS